MGVEVHTNALVTNIELGVVTAGQERIPASVILWSAGVSASPLGKMLGAPNDRAGRVLVKADLSVSGHPEVFVAGDLAAAKTADNPNATRWVPGVAPAAIQMGRFAARQIIRSLEGKPREDFVYSDKGSLAAIGHSRAVADLGRIHFSGHLAWLAWLVVHVFSLVDFRHRLLVIIEWAWAYITYRSSARLITEPIERRLAELPKPEAG